MSDYTSEFSNFLDIRVASKTTIKNYCADVNVFVRFYESVTKNKFNPSEITPGHIEYYKLHAKCSQRTLQRHLSSLRKFFLFLHEINILSAEMTKSMNKEKEIDKNLHINAFSIYLFVQKSSELTVKQYKVDVNQFLTWAKGILDFIDDEKFEENISHMVNKPLLNQYFLYLANDLRIAPSTVNRKRAALHKYIEWLEKTGGGFSG